MPRPRLAHVFLPTPSGRQRFTVFGALHGVTHEIITVTHELLEKLAGGFRDRSITLMLDNAGYQRNKFVRRRNASI